MRLYFLHRLCAIFGTFLLFSHAGAVGAIAWQMPVQKKLVELTNVSRHPVLISYYTYFIDGLEEPNRIQDEKSWLTYPAAEDADLLAHAAFESAVQARSNNKDTQAARLLGRCVHFLQILADPTLVLQDKAFIHYKPIVRRWAFEEITLIHDALQQQKGTNRAYRITLDKMNRRLKKADWPELTNAANASRQALSKAMAQSLQKQGPDARQAIQTLFHKAFASTAALQERLLALFSQTDDRAPVPEPVKSFGTLKTSKNFIVVKIWDTSCEDGDQIDLVINGHTYLSGYTLKKAPKSITATLPAYGGELVIKAVNSGSDCPPKSKPLTHVSLGIGLSGSVKAFSGNWLIRQGESKSIAISVVH
ncbi:MAG: hypothetical protein GY874_13890 [Desulfobacteraceae bacterium]|nr:hypothetical protein [Desulfobacteraceae bacterium]